MNETGPSTKHAPAGRPTPAEAGPGQLPLGPVGDLLADLTAAQHRAVTSPASPLCVLAGAGAGKTRVVTRRIAYRVLTGSAQPSHVLALTFSRRAAAEMSARLAVLGLRATAGTFHSMALAQLRQWWRDRGIAPPTVLERKGRILAHLASGRPGLAGAAVADLAGHLEWAQARLVAPEDLAAEAIRAGRDLPAPAGEVAALYQRYQHEKLRRGLVDFDDILARTAEAMERCPDFAAAQRWRWRHLFVDEFQDLNPLQHRLLDAWLGGRPDLCVVGDPNQSIYGWNGADADALAAFASRWPGAEVVRLDDNHRSTPQVVAAAGAVLGAGAMRSSRPDGPVPAVVGYPTEVAEAAAVAAAVADRRPHGLAWAEMAVLVRTNAQVDVLASELAGGGIPHRVAAGAAVVGDVTGGATGGEGPGPDSVTICSFHRAKGLEWPAVWVCGLERGLVPIGRAKTAAAEAEERRLLYVALTRAGQELHCSWARARTFGGHRVAREPSPWLALLGGDRGGPPPGPVLDAGGWRDHLAQQRRALDTPSPAAGPPFGPGRRGRAPQPALVAPDPGLLADLRAWRAQRARGAGVPAHVVLHDRTLEALASLRPATEEELLGVPGLGPVKAGRFGQGLLGLIEGHRARA